MATTDRMLFVNIPVTDVARARAFFTELDFAFDDRFCDEGNAACMVVREGSAYFMLLSVARFGDFAKTPTALPTATTPHLLAISAGDRAAVDSLCDRALTLGAKPAGDPMDMGMMYQRSFYDLDGHHWEVMWMDPNAIPPAQ